MGYAHIMCGGETRMLKGFIKTRHLLLHPITMIHTWGIRKYFKMLIKCLDHSSHCFTDFFML
jgi:hypothetical protein